MQLYSFLPTHDPWKVKVMLLFSFLLSILPPSSPIFPDEHEVIFLIFIFENHWHHHHSLAPPMIYPLFFVLHTLMKPSFDFENTYEIIP